MYRCLNIFIWISATWIIMACAGGISKQMRSQVSFAGPFNQLQQDPERFKGETVLFGGKIIQTEALQTGSEIVVLQLELNSSGRPQDNDQSQGRFLVHSTHFLDPALYPQGMLMTALGRVRGGETRTIGQMQYRYPLIELMEIKTWPMEAYPSYPRFHFGFGVGKTF